LQQDGSTTTTETAFDALDRTATRTENAGTASAKTTTFSYLGLSGEVLSEEVAAKIAASYQYSLWGVRLSQVKYQPDGTAEDSFYGYNPHTDVETPHHQRRRHPSNLRVHRVRQGRRVPVHQGGQADRAAAGLGVDQAEVSFVGDSRTSRRSPFQPGGILAQVLTTTMLLLGCRA